MRAIVLFSGGLDSLLAASVLKEQGMEVVALNIVTPFHDCTNEASDYADELGLQFVTRTLSEDYMKMVADPCWGYGKAVNPCIDCRIMMCKVASQLLKDTGAAIVATGEVVGQRPNSQKMHQLSLITRQSGLEGKLLRPLSAKVLPPTEAELDGSIDRDRLYTFTGRHRASLISLARSKYGIKRIPQPSTGCLLCEQSFAPRIRDMLRYKRLPSSWDAALLTMGRQIRIDETAKCVVGRRQSDCEALEEHFARNDRSRSLLVLPNNFQGPAAMLVSSLAPDFDDQTITHETSGPELKRLIDLAGAFILHFTRPEKYANLADGPYAELRMGGNAFEIKLVANESVSQFRIIE